MSSFAATLNSRYPLIVQIVTWLMRLLVGGLFLFSGFTKGIDVWGTLYKFNDYYGALGFEVWEGLNLAGVFILCLFEFITGYLILLGCMRRTAPIFALAIMVFMLPLTLWLAIKDPIADCGCFGDALKLTNWETFYKNVVITAGAVWLVFFNRKAVPLITPYLQWIGMVAAGAYLLAIAWIGYYYQPLIDFRPYKVGTALVETESSALSRADEDDNLRFVYEKDGERKEFTIDETLPDEDEGWVFVERYYKESENSIEKPEENVIGRHPEKNLRIYEENGREDVTEDVIGSGRQLILMIPVLSEVTAAKTWKINSFYQWCQANDVEMLATVGGNPLEIAQWKDISLAEYPIYTSDDTAIEEVVRGNPGVIYLEEGIIKWKSSLRAINIDDFQNKEVIKDPMGFARDNHRILMTFSWIFIGVTGLLILFSLFPMLLFGKGKIKRGES